MRSARKWAFAAVAAGALAVGGLGLTHGSLSSVAQADANPTGAASLTVDNFRLADQNLIGHDLYSMADAPAIVLISYGDGCPIVRNISGAIKDLQKTYGAKGVEFMMVDSNLQDTRDEVIQNAKEYGFDIPILMDTNQLVGEQLGVTRTAEVFVINPKTWQVMYRGPIDDRVTYERQKAAAEHHWAADALDAVLAGKAPAVSREPAPGCLVNFPARAKADTFQKISYAKQIAPIVQEKCVGCHQPGGIGPMALTSYEKIKGFSPMIREVIRTHRMPPYMADPTVGKFHDDKSLSPDQIKTMVHWIEAGSPRGDGPDPLASQTFAAKEWPLGKPDLILDIPSYEIPASGIVDYQYPYVVNPLKDSRWIKASTIKVGQRQGVHHILTGYMTDIPKDNSPNESHWGASVGGYAVGSESQIEPTNVGVLLPPGGAIGFQNHYTPFGKDAVDKSQIALYFYKDGEKPKYVMHNIAIADPSIVIPPNEEHHPEIAYISFPHEALLYSAFPHAHYRGASSTFSIRYPDGHEKMLLALPRYDFNWQREYVFAEPVRVPAGAKLIARYTYDNSKRNPANPDHNRTVPWGDQSFDEMLYTAIRYRWMDETSDHMLPDYDKQLAAGRLIGMFDDNLDGKVEMAELKGKPGMPIKAAFKMLDTDKDGTLSESELTAAQRFMASRRTASK